MLLNLRFVFLFGNSIFILNQLTIALYYNDVWVKTIDSIIIILFSLPIRMIKTYTTILIYVLHDTQYSCTLLWY